MRMIGTTMEINRGEVFTLNRSIIDVNGVPYILSSSFTNPYLIISVANNTFWLDGKYIKNYWLSLKSYPKFSSSTPIFVPNLIDPPAISDCVYYTDDGLGNKTYYRWDGTKYVQHSFVFSKVFLNSDTNEWIESIYQYQFKIADGQLTPDWLRNIFIGLYPGLEPPDDIEKIIKQINKIDATILKGIDLTAPIVNYTTKDMLKQPAKLIIRDNV